MKSFPSCRVVSLSRHNKPTTRRLLVNSQFTISSISSISCCCSLPYCCVLLLMWKRPCSLPLFFIFLCTFFFRNRDFVQLSSTPPKKSPNENKNKKINAIKIVYIIHKVWPKRKRDENDRRTTTTTSLVTWHSRQHRTSRPTIAGLRQASSSAKQNARKKWEWIMENAKIKVEAPKKKFNNSHAVGKFFSVNVELTTKAWHGETSDLTVWWW